MASHWSDDRLTVAMHRLRPADLPRDRAILDTDYIFDVACRIDDAVRAAHLRLQQSAVFRYCRFQVQEMIAMRLTNQNLDQLQTVFGDEFVREHHSEPTDRHLPQSDVYGVIRSLVESMPNGVLKTLRSALSLRQSRSMSGEN